MCARFLYKRCVASSSMASTVSTSASMSLSESFTPLYQEGSYYALPRRRAPVLLCVLVSVGYWNPREPRSLSARMSCQDVPDGAAMNTDCIFGSGSSSDQIRHSRSRDKLLPDSAEETCDLYSKEIILCDIIQKREPSFLQRTLGYKIHANQKKRIQITLSLSGSSNPELPAENIFPLHALFAKPIGDVLPENEENIPVYQFSPACLLTCFGESGRNSHTEATFVIRDLKTLADIILVSCGQVGQTPDENNCSRSNMENVYRQKLEGQCFWGKIPNDLLCSSLENCVDLSLGRTKQLVLPITMNPGFIETKILKQNSYLAFCPHKVNAMCPCQLQVSICAQQAGARDMFKSPYNSYLYNDVPLSSLPHIIRLRAGNVVFKYENNICQEEVTEDFSCSFCLIKCGSFEGLQYHLLSSHDRIKFEFSTTQEKQVVNVSLKNDTWRNEDFPAGIDPRQRTFSYFSNKKRQRSTTATEAIVPSKVTEAIIPSKATEVIIPSKSTEIIVPTKAIEAMVPSKATETIVLTKATETIKHGHLLGTSVSDTSVDPTYSLHGNHLSSPRVLQFGKTRRLSTNQFDPRNRQLLQKRQFFHSHKGQQMTFEEVLSDRDSEDEVDDDVADFEDRRMLDDFINITKDEKCIMHMWNSFVSRQRVKADSHMPWACKAFSKHHGQLLAGCPSLLGCWRLFMIKLWNHNLLDGRTMNDCNMIIDGFKNKTLPK